MGTKEKSQLRFENEATKLLICRGYIVKPAGGQKNAKHQLADGIRSAQRFYGLPEDGKVSKGLLDVLSNPCCGVPDVGSLQSVGSQNQSNRWLHRNLTFQFGNFLPGVPPENCRRAARSAFDSWGAVCTLFFTEVETGGDIRIFFYDNRHGDGFEFDRLILGIDNEWAHAFGPGWTGNSGFTLDPDRGDIHVDKREAWSTAQRLPPGKLDLQSILLHEIGHAIGLQHSGNPCAVMCGQIPETRRVLHTEDIERVRLLYPA